MLTVTQFSFILTTKQMYDDVSSESLSYYLPVSKHMVLEEKEIF